MHEPGAAELARTAVHAAPMLTVRRRGCRWDVPAHATGLDGRPLLLVGGGGPLALQARSAEPPPSTLDAAHVSPIPVADRVRAAVRLYGHLVEVPRGERAAAAMVLAGRRQRDALPGDPEAATAAMLRFEVERVQVTTPGPPAAVDLRQYAVALPDPVVDYEAAQLRHLLHAHVEEVSRLCALIDPAATARATRVFPVGLDRFGFVLRVETPDGASRERVPFAAPLRRVTELASALRALLARATVRR